MVRPLVGQDYHASGEEEDNRERQWRTTQEETKTNKGKHDNEKDTKEPKNSEAKTQKPKKCKSSKKKGQKKTTADSGSDVESNVSIDSGEGSEHESDWE